MSARAVCEECSWRSVPTTPRNAANFARNHACGSPCAACGRIAQLQGRGLCIPCCKDPAVRIDHATVVQRWEDYADDYAMLRDEGYPLDAIAARLDLTFAALDKALSRHAGDSRARRPYTAAQLASVPRC